MVSVPLGNLPIVRVDGNDDRPLSGTDQILRTEISS